MKPDESPVRQLIKFSNYSLCITLPKEFIDNLGWLQGDRISFSISKDKNKLVLTKEGAKPRPGNLPEKPETYKSSELTKIEEDNSPTPLIIPDQIFEATISSENNETKNQSPVTPETQKPQPETNFQPKEQSIIKPTQPEPPKPQINQTNITESEITNSSSDSFEPIPQLN